MKVYGSVILGILAGTASMCAGIVVLSLIYQYAQPLVLGIICGVVSTLTGMVAAACFVDAYHDYKERRKHGNRINHEG